MTTILFIGAILLLVIFGMLLKVQSMVDVVRGSFTKRAGFSNQVNAVLFLIFLVVGLGLFYWITVDSRQYYLPEAASEHGPKIDNQFWTTMIIITIVFVGTHLLLFTFPYLYQFKESRKATFFPDNHKLEFVWTIIPAIVLTILVLGGYKVWSEVTSPAPANHISFEIVGKQFNWMLRYPGKDGILGKHNFRKIDATNTLGIDFTDKNALDDFMPGEIHIPVGIPVKFNIRSRDVLHSVFAIHFRQKMDAVPGMPTSFWFTPTKTTADMRAETGNPNFTYEIACTEVCGAGHFGMKSKIVVDEPEDYAKWLETQQSFLSQNPDYIKDVPENLRSLAEQQLPKQAATDSTTVVKAAASIQ
jgi:cytochrome c oxidase subunit 2